MSDFSVHKMVSGLQIFCSASLIFVAGMDAFLSMSYWWLCRWDTNIVFWLLVILLLNSPQTSMLCAGLLHISSIYCSCPPSCSRSIPWRLLWSSPLIGETWVGWVVHCKKFPGHSSSYFWTFPHNPAISGYLSGGQQSSYFWIFIRNPDKYPEIAGYLSSV